MRIGLIFPNKDRRYKTVHLGIGYLMAYARQNHDDLEFTYLDTRTAGRKETRDFFNTSFDLIGITVYSPVYREVIALHERIRRNHPSTIICLGGPYVTTVGKEIFRLSPADFAVVGEGEQVFSDIIEHLKGRKAAEEIPGLMVRKKSGEIFYTLPREKIRDLDSLPFPAYDLLPMGRYPLHRIVSSRGCPYACSWCNSSSLWGQSFRQRSPEMVIEEIKHLLQHYGKKIFVFGDNSLNINLSWLTTLCDLLVQENIRILWSASVRADLMTREVAQKMRKAGCYNVAIGIESANNEILKNMGKATTREKILEGVGYLKEAGIEVLSQYVIGSPGDTLDTIRESIAFAKNSGCDYINFYTVLPFRGTEQWKYIEKHGKFLVNHTHEMHTIKPRVVFETPEFPYADRVEAIRLVKKEGFYSNKDKKSWLFDLAKDTARMIQRFLPPGAGEKIYALMKSIYQIKVVKKNNL